MKVILIARIAKLGNVGDVVDVRDGYSKNFLIPQKKAIFYSANNYKIFEAKKQQFEVDNHQKLSIAEKTKSKLDGKDIIILENASDDGRLYGSVTTANVANKINDILGEKLITRNNVLFKKPIKDIGVHDVKVDLYSDIFSNIKVVVSRSEAEAKNIIAGIKEALVSKDVKEASGEAVLEQN